MEDQKRFFCRVVLVCFVMVVTLNAQTSLTAEEYVAQGNKLASQKQFDAAIESYKEAIKLNPNLASAYLGIGTAYGSVGRVGDAFEPMKTAVRLAPENALARINLAVTLSNLRRYDEALTELSEAKSLSPKDGRIYNMTGNIFSNTGRFEDAIASYKKSVELNPDEPSNYHNIGLMYIRLGKFPEAVEPLQAALRLYPKYQNARYLLSNAYSKAGRYAEAIESWTKFLELVPNGYEALNNRAWNYLYEGNYDQEIAADSQAFLTNHGWKDTTSVYMVILANIGYRKAGMFPEAQKILFEASKKSNTNTWIYSVIRYLSGEISEQELMQLAVDNDKKTEAHAYLGMDLLLKGKTEDARKHFEWVKDFGNKRFTEYPLAVEELKRLVK